MFIVAQVFGILGALSMMISSFQKNRKRLFIFLIFDNIFHFLEYIFLNAYAGAITNMVGFIRTILFRNKEKFSNNKIILLIIIFLYLIINIFTYDGVSSLIPAFASIIYALALWQNDTSKIRIGTSIMLFMWFVYNLIVGAYVTACSELILFISCLIAIIKIDLFNKKV